MRMPTLPPLIRFLIRHALIGFGLAVVFVALLLVFDVGGLAGLMMSSPSGPLAAVVLTFAMGLTFSSIQMGFAVMFLAGR